VKKVSRNLKSNCSCQCEWFSACQETRNVPWLCAIDCSERDGGLVVKDTTTGEGRQESTQGYGGGILASLHTGLSSPKSKLYYDRRSAGQSVLMSGTHLGPGTNFSPSFCKYFQAVNGVLDVGRPLSREVGSMVLSCCWASPAQSF
jgi:hypothetical protein